MIFFRLKKLIWFLPLVILLPFLGKPQRTAFAIIGASCCSNSNCAINEFCSGASCTGVYPVTGTCQSAGGTGCVTDLDCGLGNCYSCISGSCVSDSAWCHASIGSCSSCQSGLCSPSTCVATPSPTPGVGGVWYCSGLLTCPDGVTTYTVVCNLPCGTGGICSNQPQCNQVGIQCNTATDCPPAVPIVGNCMQEVGGQCPKWDQCGCASSCNRTCVNNQCKYNSGFCNGNPTPIFTATPTLPLTLPRPCFPFL